MRSVHNRLDGVNTALTAIMVQNKLLPEQIDQAVANRIREMVPDIVRAELGRHTNESYATDLNAALNTFLEEVELGIPRDRLNRRLDQIREYRNRVIASHSYSALTLCAAMDIELAAMKVLDYSQDQAVIVSNVYRQEFNSKGRELVKIQKDTTRQYEIRAIERYPSEIIQAPGTIVYRRNDGNVCDGTPKFSEKERFFAVSPELGSFPYRDFSVADYPTMSENGSCKKSNGCTRCYTNPVDLRRAQELWATKVLNYRSFLNNILGMRASVAQLAYTIFVTRKRLEREIARWDA